MGTRLTKANAAPALKDATEVIWHKTVIRVYPVTDSTLEEMVGGYNSIFFLFFGICVGAAISLFIAFKTSSAPDGPYYLAGFISFLGLSVITGTIGITKYVKACRCKSKLYREAIPLELQKQPDAGRSSISTV